MNPPNATATMTTTITRLRTCTQNLPCALRTCTQNSPMWFAIVDASTPISGPPCVSLLYHYVSVGFLTFPAVLPCVRSRAAFPLRLALRPALLPSLHPSPTHSLPPPQSPSPFSFSLLSTDCYCNELLLLVAGLLFLILLLQADLWSLDLSVCLSVCGCVHASFVICKP